MAFCETLKDVCNHSFLNYFRVNIVSRSSSESNNTSYCVCKSIKKCQDFCSICLFSKKHIEFQIKVEIYYAFEKIFALKE